MDVKNVADDIKAIEQEQAGEAPVDAYLEQEHTAEEEAANKAAAELQLRKKRRKKRNRILTVLAIVLIAVGILGYRRYQAYQAAQAEAAADVLALEDGEELIYGEITQVVGNDITVAVVEEDTSAPSEDVNAKAPDESADSAPDSSVNIPNGNMTGGASGADDAVGADDAAGDMPSGGSGEMPSMTAGDTAGSMPSMPGGGSAPSGMGAMTRTTYTQTGETREYEIPVGTDVTSMLGSTTTFAKLKTGNVIGIVVQAGTDNILRIKIVQ